MDAPLKGIKVLELGTHVAVPSACRLMAEYGADVIKIETAGGDPWRYSGLNVNLTIDDFSCPVFTIQNNGKRLISLDLKTEGGRAVFMKLLENTDVFCTSVRMKGLAKMGLDYDTLKKSSPSSSTSTSPATVTAAPTPKPPASTSPPSGLGSAPV